MANHFLKRVAEDVYGKLGQSVSDAVFIFPNKRPGTYFLEELALLLDKPIPAPLTFSIEEFIASHSKLKIADPLHLLFTLYKVYQGLQPEEEFEKFHNWGNLLIKDYDEIDRYLLKTESLFNNLSAIKEIEQDFMPDPLQSEFWETIQQQSPQLLQQRFLQLWDVYKQSYYELRRVLLEQQLAFPGMCYREVAELCQAGKLDLDGKKYVFIGFNALSKSEEMIMASLLRQQKALIYWDTDEWYLFQEREEAGLFIRKALKNLPSHRLLPPEKRLTEEAKNITVTGVPLKVGQAKALGVELQQFFKQKPEGATAIVLPDESLLLPVLHALSPEIGDINITAGYPLQHTSLFGLFEHIISLQENYAPESYAFYHKDVLAVLEHPYLRSMKDERLEEIAGRIKKGKLVFINQAIIEKTADCEILRIIFRPVKKAGELLEYFRAILSGLKTNNSYERDAALFEAFEEILDYLDKLLLSQEVELSRNTFLRLFRDAVSATRLPIPEKAAGIQLMGMLETRCLDFDNLFILSVNEGSLPASKKGHSYIPFDLRKAFGLPTFDEQDSLYAYYFYRLVQGAKNIFLIYNAETGSKGEEKSRYIRQIEYYLTKANPQLNYKQRFYSLPLQNRQPENISIEKDDHYYKALQERSSGKGLSPSFISSYFVCSLQFLLERIVKLAPAEEISEDWEASDFGTFFHALMEEVYKDYVGKTVSRSVIESRKEALDELMTKVLQDELKSQKDHLLQRNSVIAETIKVLAEKVLEADMEYAPFRLLATEEKLEQVLPMASGPFKEVRLQGIIDRVDEKDGVLRIVDYKTGHVKRFNFNFKDADEQLSKDNKEAFQTLFYSYLYSKQHAGSSLKPSLLPLREINRGYRQVNEEYGLFGENDCVAFEQKLKNIISTVLDKEQEIRQTEDLSICSFCHYRHICLR